MPHAARFPSVLRPLSLALITLGLGYSLPSLANEPSQRVDTLVVTASGFEQKITAAPASISVITREELERRPYMTLLDAVRDLEGVDVGETRDKTGQGSISIRGMGGDYTLILINGRRQNNHGDIYPNDFGGNQFNHIPPLDAIERIEVIRGPAATLYGADAMGGVINIITRRDIENWNGSISFGRTYQTDRDYGDNITTDFYLAGPLLPGTLSMALRGSLYDRLASNPNYSPVTDPAGTEHQRNLGFGSGGRTVANTNLAGGFSLYWTPDERQRITLDYDTSEQSYDNASSQVGTLDSFESIWTARRINGQNGRVAPRVGYNDDQRFTRDQWGIAHDGNWGWADSQVSFSHISTHNHGRTLPFTIDERNQLQEMYDGTGAYAGLSEDERKALAEDTFLPRPDRKMESREYRLDAMLTSQIANHQLIVGGQITRGELEDGVFGMYGGNYQAGEVQEHHHWSIFAENSWFITDSLSLTGGLRYDHHDVFGGQTSPRLYAVYSLSDEWTVKGGISTGYKTPKTTDLFPGIRGFGGQGTGPWAGNPELQPETSVNREIALYYDSFQGHSFNITFFQTDFEDKISGGGDAIPPCEIAAAGQRCADVGTGWADLYPSFSQSHNIDRVDLEGVEVAGRLRLPYDLSLRANYTYTDSEQKTGNQAGRPLNNTARHMANASLEWQASDRLNLNLSLESRSKRYRGWDTERDQAIYFKDYEVFHLGATYQLADNITLHGRVNNLFDRDFTSYQTQFTDNGDGTYTPSYRDDYNNKDSRRNFWIGVNLSF
ncbi:TonB-dependent receptor [Marinospirillum sp. MEB164]|uniref:TonB-dependent receptor n=1 Tax=Marinospirillum alkalitolerans TaxID=3123374 RepID=A0ABW8PXR4_9GAMM